MGRLNEDGSRRAPEGERGHPDTMGDRTYVPRRGKGEDVGHPPPHVTSVRTGSGRCSPIAAGPRPRHCRFPTQPPRQPPSGGTCHPSATDQTQPRTNGSARELSYTTEKEQNKTKTHLCHGKIEAAKMAKPLTDRAEREAQAPHERRVHGAWDRATAHRPAVERFERPRASVMSINVKAAGKGVVLLHCASGRERRWVGAPKSR